ncbi:MAG: cell division protein ZapA [Lachnospiraceae bacterium]|nr:cell division protein ZapA [Lachnospiraceae bacterium]
MSAKKVTNVIIGGKMYTMSGYEEEEYLQKVATYINHKLEEVEKLESYSQLSSDMKNILLNLNLADDYFKAKERVLSNEAELKHKDQEIYNLKHELVSHQVNAEESEKEIQELKEEIQELRLNKAKLEATLEDALLGTGESDS